MVRVGALRSLVEPAEVRRPTRSERRSVRPRGSSAAEGAVRSSDELAKIPVRTPDITLDARGMRVDDALRETDRFLDRGLLDDQDVLFILHGHGSGRLRAALRQHLGQSPMVRQIRPADRAQGGDAVTVVWLR
jgi:DNA mismatch repair protein MutS2